MNGGEEGRSRTSSTEVPDAVYLPHPWSRALRGTSTSMCNGIRPMIGFESQYYGHLKHKGRKTHALCVLNGGEGGIRTLGTG